MARPGLKLVIAALLLVPLLVGAQSVFRWVDKDGKVHYGDAPPPADAKNVQQKRINAGSGIDTADLPAAVREAIARNPVTAYISNCGPLCDGARGVLTKRGVPYTVRDPSKNEDDAKALKDASGGMEVPFLQVGARNVRGFTEDGWNSALDAGGYPRVNPFTKPPVPKKADSAASANDAAKAAGAPKTEPAPPK